MNRFVLLILLIVILPTQLFITYIIHSTNPGNIQDISIFSKSIRESLFVTSASSFINYFSSYEHIKELFFIPYVPKRKKGQARQASSKFDDRTGKDRSLDHSEWLSQHTTSDNSRGTIKSSIPVSRQSRQTHFDNNNKNNGNEESAAREVEAYNKKYVYFARSQSVRMRSTSKINVEFTIGDVVRHTVDGYHGVIVGWDHTCQAPEEWIANHYSQSVTNLSKDPHYLVLADSNKQTSYFYIPQSHLIKEHKTKVKSPKLSKYFAKYSKSRNKYYAKDWLLQLYPED